MKKRFVLHILAACMLLTLLAPGLCHGNGPPVESCGDGLSWSLDGSTLTVSGSGASRRTLKAARHGRAARIRFIPSYSPAA